ncbi:glycosyltransferase family 2 protein [Ruegeria sp. 6PALISEP08]|uniref:glycosyltransferase n=1 Tax=Ruegeria sp. 6PALISEP08 TaxID=1225660 RepID=UPI00067E6EA8|nr:glycosyltransferase [Ruegeria sp. 6PALISEP08]
MMQHQISVVVPCVNSLSDFRECVAALQEQTGPQPEIIAVIRLGPDFIRDVETEFPDVHILAAAEEATIPQMRAAGIRAATADAIGVIEDHVLVPPNWTLRMLDEIADGSDVVAGPVDNEAKETLVDWAAFLCEYSAVLPPLNDGPSDWLPGNNTVYRRDVLERFDTLLDDGKWENHLHDHMRADGVSMTLRNDIVSGHKMHYTFGLYLTQRYLYSKSFAGARVSEESSGKRLLMGLVAFALPPIVYYRVVRNVITKGRHVHRLWPSLPLLIPFSLSWGLGEVAGYWFGAGRSLSKVR